MADNSIIMNKYTVYELNKNVKVIEECLTKLIIIGTEKITIIDTNTGKKKKITDKTEIEIISYYTSDDQLIVENVASKLKIDKKRVLKALKYLIKKGFTKYVEVNLLEKHNSGLTQLFNSVVKKLSALPVGVTMRSRMRLVN